MKQPKSITTLRQSFRKHEYTRSRVISKKRDYKEYAATLYRLCRKQGMTEKETERAILEEQRYKRLLRSYDKAEGLHLRAEHNALISERLVEFEIAQLKERKERESWNS